MACLKWSQEIAIYDVNIRSCFGIIYVCIIVFFKQEVLLFLVVLYLSYVSLSLQKQAYCVPWKLLHVKFSGLLNKQEYNDI